MATSPRLSVLAALSPAGAARCALARLERRREVRAARDPRWEAIEARRRRAGRPGLQLVLSKELTWADLRAQQRIAVELTPDPWWLPAAERVSGWSLREVVRSLVAFFQRGRRGWADRDVVSLHQHLCSSVAGQLEGFASSLSSFPPGAGFESLEEWRGELRLRARALRRFDDAGAGAARDRFFAMLEDPGTSEAELEAARMEMLAVEEADRAAARDALRWVADHLDDLWD